jgi:hypothetical protein
VCSSDLQDVKIRVRLTNQGRGYAYVNLNITDGHNQVGPLIGSYAPLIAGLGEIYAEVIWRNAGPGGSHVLNFTALVEAPQVDADMSSNYYEMVQQVYPTILVVDDDAHSNDGTEYDTSGYMREALSSGGFVYDFFSVASGNGPSYNGTVPMLKTYDVVIWMCGYETKTTLTVQDQANLAKYLTDTSGGRNTTANLWLIGQGILADPNVQINTPPTFFLRDYLHVSTFANINPGPTAKLVGNATHPVGKNWTAAANNINITTRITGRGNSFSLQGDALARRMFNRAGASADAISYENTSRMERVVFFPWDFSRIKDLGVQTDVAYAVVLWLGRLQSTRGVDFAVTGQTITPNRVYFRQQVNVSAWIRNNGAANYSCEVDLVLDGQTLPGSNKTMLIPGKGGKVLYWHIWNATVTGRHTLVVRADPRNLWPNETSETNNQVAGYVTSTTIDILYRLLVVDDDGSSNNGGGSLYDETAPLLNALTAIDCTYERVNVTLGYLVSTELVNYSAVIWVGGSAIDCLATQDITKLTNYIGTWGGQVWLLGKNAARQSINTSFMSAYFGVSGTINDLVLPTYIEGVTNDTVAHGLRYRTSAGTCDGITPSASGKGILYQSKAAPRYLGVRSTTYYTAVTAFNLSKLANGGWNEPTGDQARAELTYMVLTWLRRPDSRNELKISNVDISISDQHPQIGNSYILKATIRSYTGYQQANALVRFLDENTTIGSDSVSVNPGQNVTAEMIWRPLATGMRSVRVEVDPINELAEVFDWFNNYASYKTFVYFFYDDMEGGTSKWSHSTTLLNINGEGPLDFFGASYTKVDTNVVKGWSYGTDLTTGVVNTTKQCHSYNTSYYMAEPKASGSTGNGTRGLPNDVNAANVNKTAVTPTLNLTGYSSVKLTFWQKYNLAQNRNGGILGLMFYEGGTWKLKYIVPSGTYTGALATNVTHYDIAITGWPQSQIKWCWNGVSSGGTNNWDFVDVDLMSLIPNSVPSSYLNQVRVVFKYLQVNGLGGTGDGWYIDDVQIKATRAATDPTSGDRDVWSFTTTQNRTGNLTAHAWWNRNPDPAQPGLKPGIDNSLISIPIDLTNAITATLGAYFKFNINSQSGTPPDSLRVEVTPDGGQTWHAINLGVRTCQNLSGTDTYIVNGKSFSGVNAGYNWVEAGTLSRLNIDLSDWRGHQIQMRFRIVTNSLLNGATPTSYNHYKVNSAPWGVYIDDITVTGTTKTG